MGRRLFPDPRWEDRVPRWQHPLWAVDSLQLPQLLSHMQAPPCALHQPFLPHRPLFLSTPDPERWRRGSFLFISLLPTCVCGGRTGFTSGLTHQPPPMPSSYWCTEHLLCSAPSGKTLDISIFNIFTLLYFWKGPMAAVSLLFRSWR